MNSVPWDLGYPLAFSFLVFCKKYQVYLLLLFSYVLFLGGGWIVPEVGVIISGQCMITGTLPLDQFFLELDVSDHGI